MSVEIKWIKGDCTETSAGDADELAQLDFGTIQIKPQEEEGGESKVSLKVGNIGTSTAENVELEFTGEGDHLQWKGLSKNEEGPFESTLSLNDIGEDEISDVVWAQSEVPYDAETGSHSCYLTCEYTYV